jgi:hypothetical protein
MRTRLGKLGFRTLAKLGRISMGFGWILGR